MENIIITKNEEDYKLIKSIQDLKEQLGGFEKDVIREYIVKDLTEKEAFKMWYEEEKITLVEYQYVKYVNGI